MRPGSCDGLHLVGRVRLVSFCREPNRIETGTRWEQSACDESPERHHGVLKLPRVHAISHSVMAARYLGRVRARSRPRRKASFCCTP
jgi:hypothetical protein